MQTQPDNLALLNDLYEFTMAEVYFQNHMFAPATFSLFIRAYPPQRGYFVSLYPVAVATGLESLQKRVVHEVIEKELGES